MFNAITKENREIQGNHATVLLEVDGEVCINFVTVTRKYCYITKQIH